MISPVRITGAILLVALAGCDNASTAGAGADGASASVTPAVATTTATAATTPAVATTALAAAAAPATKDWNAVVVATPEGGFRVGNPDAKVKLLEFASLTCPHCREFHEAAMPALKSKYVASGNVSYEFRNFVLNGPDFAASLLARCLGAPSFFGMLNAFFTDQATWTQPFATMTPAESARLSALPPEKQIAALAEVGKLDAYVRARGIPRAKFDQCLADAKAQAVLTSQRTQATDTYKLTGTPGFIINGKMQEGVYTWAGLEPKLQAALQ